MKKSERHEEDLLHDELFGLRGNPKKLTRDQEVALILRYQENPRDPEVLEECKQQFGSLVVGIARNSTDKDIELPDRVIMGYKGMIAALKAFDPDRGTRFSTYATLWIRRAITRGAQAESGLIRLPTRIYEGRRSVDKAIKQLKAEAGDSVTIAQVAEKLGMTPDYVELVINARVKCVSPISGKNDKDEYLARVPDQSALSDGEIVDRISTTALLEEVYSIIQSSSRFKDIWLVIFNMYYGIGIYSPMKRSEIALQLETSPRQVGATLETIHTLLKRHKNSLQSKYGS